MNILKNFEALFVVTLGLACAANYALDDAAPTVTPSQPQTAYAAPSAPAMQVVVVSAKRLSAEQKKQALLDDSKAALAADNAANASKI